MLSQAGMQEKAKERLDDLKEEGVSEVEENRLERIIGEIDGTNPVEELKEQYKNTDSVVDLITLVEELERRDDWTDLCIYAEILFTKTHFLRDAERYAKALIETQEYAPLIKFLRENSDLLKQSKKSTYVLLLVFIQ